MVDITLYKVGVIQTLEGCGNHKAKNGKALKACKVRISPVESEELITVVTAASNVREGSRVVVAPSGTTFMSPDGEEHMITKSTIGGVVSEGMFCDSSMLGWSGGGKGVAVQVPNSFDIGSPPPSEKPRSDNVDIPVEVTPAPEIKGLFEKKLTKEEKKKLAEERKKKRREAKSIKQQKSTNT